MAATLFTTVLALTASLAGAASIPRALRVRDDHCSTQGSLMTPEKSFVCYTYCEKSNQRIQGAPVKVGSDINCDTKAGCSDQHSQTVTISQSFTISIGIEAGSQESEEGILKGSATAGASWSWSKSTANSDVWTFNLSEGDMGYVVFRPWLQQSCGDMAYYAQDCADDQGMDCVCETTPFQEDKNACGRTPNLLGDFADGEFTFCYTGGPSKGKGC